ncbi:MAG: hypothetical protein ACYSPI_08900 [Planctomycetota bacterium]
MGKIGITVLTVGIRNKSGALRTLPLRVLVMDRPAEAVTQLLKDKIDLVISHWVLIDTPNGELLRYIIAAKPNLPTIAFVKAGDSQQEALARQIGVSVVLSDDINDAYFRQILRQIFDLAETPPIRGICQVSQG